MRHAHLPKKWPSYLFVCTERNNEAVVFDHHHHRCEWSNEPNNQYTHKIVLHNIFPKNGFPFDFFMSTGNQKTKFNKKNNKKSCSSFIKFLCFGISFRLCVSFGWNTRINGLDVYYYSLHRYKLLQRQKRSSNSSLPDVIVQMSLYTSSRFVLFHFPQVAT